MSLDFHTNFLYLADCLAQKHPAFYQHFTTALNQQDIPFALLPGTNDIWAVDYMPIQTAINRFIRFTYNPSYLQSRKYQSTKSDTDTICKANWILRPKVYHLFHSIVYQRYTPKFTTWIEG